MLFLLILKILLKQRLLQGNESIHLSKNSCLNHLLQYQCYQYQQLHLHNHCNQDTNIYCSFTIN